MDIKLLHGDCLERMKEIPDGGVDLTVTSPPYDNLRSYNGNNEQWGEHVWKAAIRELYRVTASGGVVVWVVGDATIKGSETGTSFRQALWAMDCGFNLHDTMIWEKQTFSAVGALRSRYAPVFDYMFILSKGAPKTFNPIIDRITGKHRVKKGNIRQADGTMKPMSRQGATYGGGAPAQRFNVWKCNTEMSNAVRTLHPAVFPEKLAHDHIISWSNPEDTVLDPFMGSGTTGVACINTNRKFIGIELDPTYFDIAYKRIEDAQRQVRAGSYRKK